jgi:hypothetical protein
MKLEELNEAGMQAHPKDFMNKVLNSYQNGKISYEQAAEHLKKHYKDPGDVEMAMDALNVIYGDIEAEYDEDDASHSDGRYAS